MQASRPKPRTFERRNDARLREVATDLVVLFRRNREVFECDTGPLHLAIDADEHLVVAENEVRHIAGLALGLRCVDANLEGKEPLLENRSDQVLDRRIEGVFGGRRLRIETPRLRHIVDQHGNDRLHELGSN